ncbi:DUF1028 domain-containing protein [Sphingomonas sp. LT1P40]|uniref:DUF1028 domain-containing protein n=1 Tax=Alteristakelama amylovorans TaxID=3096166 RepID=UPI002FC74E7F
MHRATPLTGLALALFHATPAAATWTIVAVDPKTGEVGSAGASCTPFVAGVVRLVPARGAIVAQAASNMQAKADGAAMIADGKDAATVVAAISDRRYDTSAPEQQYGVVTLAANGRPSAAAFTGGETAEVRGHLTARGVAVQGNMLVSRAVLTATLAAWRAAERRGLRMAERLLLALEAGSRAGGDARCGVKTAQSAYLGVAKPDDAPDRLSLRIVVSTAREDSTNPVSEVRRRFDKGG